MATLKSLVDETTNIKNELIECHGNLKNILISKYVECTDNDKLSSLIAKIPTLKVQTNVPIPGTAIQLYYRPNEKSANKETIVDTFEYSGIEGSIKMQFQLQGANANGTYGYVKIERGGVIVYDETVTVKSSSYVKCSLDLDVKNGDIITLSQKHSQGSYYCYTKEVLISCDYLVV